MDVQVREADAEACQCLSVRGVSTNRRQIQAEEQISDRAIALNTTSKSPEDLVHSKNTAEPTYGPAGEESI